MWHYKDNINKFNPSEKVEWKERVINYNLRVKRGYELNEY